jgi:hypothetical protein
MRQVKGTLFADYVRMIRRRKETDWSQHLQAEDLELLRQRIDPSEWYPMESFERLGLAVLREIAQDRLEVVRSWGRASVTDLSVFHQDLIVPQDPRESLMRVQVLRSTFFDFPAVDLEYLSDREARFKIDYGMSPRAEEAACHQVLGFFDELLALAGAKQPKVSLMSRTWEGDPETLVELSWR